MTELWEIFARGDTQALGFEAVLLYLLLTFVLSQGIAWVYVATHHGVSYSRTHVQSLVLLSVIVTIVMLAIGNNVARAFGLFGALALIRFRTPVKDIRDTVFLFVSVAIGITVGSQNLVVAIVGTAVVALLALYLSWTRFGSRLGHDAVLRFHLPDDHEDGDSLRQILRGYCQRFSLVHLREGGANAPVEHTYQLKLVDPKYSEGLVTEMKALSSVSGVSLHLQDGDVEV